MPGRMYKTLALEVVDHVGWLTIDHPPLNLFDRALMSDMMAAARHLSEDEQVRVVVVQSADPDFFIAHADVTLIEAVAAADPASDPDSSFFHAMTEQFRQMPKPTLGKIRGIARGGGLEFLAALDMRFCARETTRLGQPEVTLGIIPGGGGTSRWPRLIGYARAMELMLGGRDFDADEAERYGLVNRALPEAELDDWVDQLARRMAGFAPHAIRLIKQVGQGQGSLEDSLAAEHRAFLTSARHADALAQMRRFMERGGQTRPFEAGHPFD
ncbi:MAG: enoyl-CoA hydratase/isomerase family protein [Henriciella sp.]